MGVKLHYKDRDEGKLFRRPHWNDGLLFSWFKNGLYYAYCTVTDQGDIVFNKAPEWSDYEYSRVGEAVLQSGDIMTEEDMKEIEMGKNVNYIGGNYNVVKVTYEVDTFDEDMRGGYTFKIDTNIKVEKGDMLVVESASGFGLVRVTEFFERGLDTKTIKEFNKATAWVVDKVDETQQNYRREASDRKKFIVKQLEERKEAMEEMAIYKVLASQDPEAAKLIAELENLVK